MDTSSNCSPLESQKSAAAHLYSKQFLIFGFRRCAAGGDNMPDQQERLIHHQKLNNYEQFYQLDVGG